MSPREQKTCSHDFFKVTSPNAFAEGVFGHWSISIHTVGIQGIHEYRRTSGISAKLQGTCYPLFYVATLVVHFFPYTSPVPVISENAKGY